MSDTHDQAVLAAIVPLRAAGFALHWLKPKEKRPVAREWSTIAVASLTDLQRSYVSGYNLGVRLGEPSAMAAGFYLYAIDFDIRIAELADEAWAAFKKLFPELDITRFPSVISGSGGESRHLYFASDKLFTSKRLALSDGKHRTPDGKWHYDWEIELFGTGKQVALPPSIHPDTALPYVWEREFDFDGFDPFPSIPSDQIEALGVVEATEYAFETRPPLDFKPGQLERDLDVIPVSELHYDDWVRLGQALHHQFGGSQEGLDLWLKHTKRSTKYTGERQDRDMRRSKWRSFGKYRGQPVTMGTIRAWAQEQRSRALADEFDDLDDEHDARLPPETLRQALMRNPEGRDLSKYTDEQLDTVIHEAGPLWKPGAAGDDFDELLDAPKAAAADEEWDGGELTEEEKQDGLVAKLNKRHAVAFVEGKTVILTNKTNGGVAYGSVTDLHNFYENKRIATDKASEPITKYWMRHKERRSYPNGIVFAPEGGPSGAYNHWQGFSCEPDASQSCVLFLQHLKQNVCGGVEEVFDWVIRWFAHMIQRPWEKPGTALVLKGRKGSGKDTIGDYIGGLFPRHHTKISNAEHLYGRFNAHQEQTLLLHVEEGFWAGNKAAESSLKSTITSENVLIEPKGLNAFMIASVLRIFISSNENWVVPATFDERRFCVLNVAPAKSRDTEFFGQLRHEMYNGGRAALLHHLQSVDLTDFDVRNPPMTEGLRDQKIASLKNVEKWWMEVLTEGTVPGTMGGGLDDDVDWSTSVNVGRSTLRLTYQNWMEKRRWEGAILDEANFGKHLKEMVPELQSIRPRKDSSSNRVRAYQVPSLGDCRASFEGCIGCAIDWDGAD